MQRARTQALPASTQVLRCAQNDNPGG